MQQGGCCLSRDSPVAVQCLSRSVCCSVGTQPCVFSSCVCCADLPKPVDASEARDPPHLFSCVLL